MPACSANRAFLTRTKKPPHVRSEVVKVCCTMKLPLSRCVAVFLYCNISELNRAQKNFSVFPLATKTREIPHTECNQWPSLGQNVEEQAIFSYAPVDPANRSTSSWGNCVASAIWESVSFPKAIKAVAVRRADSIRPSSNFFSPNFSINSHMVCTPSASALK